MANVRTTFLSMRHESMLVVVVIACEVKDFLDIARVVAVYEVASVFFCIGA